MTVASEVSTAAARDGTPLLTRHWPAGGQPWAAVLLLHGIAEHSGRHERTGGLLAAAGLDTHAFDLRGHGASGGRPVYVERWDVYLDDVAGRMDALPAGLPRVLLGHSMGALIALTYTLDGRRPQPGLLVLSALPLEASVPRWQLLAAPVLGRLLPTLVLANPIDPGQLANDPAVGSGYAADPLVRPRSTARLGMEFFGAMSRGRREAAFLDRPTLVLHGADDTLVPPSASAPLADLSVVERRVYPGLRHETMNEPEGPRVVAEVVAWLRERILGPGVDPSAEWPDQPGPAPR